MALRQRVCHHTTIKNFLSPCHWISHGILFLSRCCMLGFHERIVTGVVFFFLFFFSFLPRDSRLVFKIFGQSSLAGYIWVSILILLIVFVLSPFVRFYFLNFNLDFLFFGFFKFGPKSFLFLYFFASFLNFQLFLILPFNKKN